MISVMQTPNMTFADLDRLRESFGIAQKDICDRMNIAESSYSRWRSGGRIRRSSLTSLRDALREEIKLRLSLLDAA